MAFQKLEETVNRVLGVPFHPLLFCVFPILLIYANNLDEVYGKDVLSSLGVSLVSTLILYGVLWAVSRKLYVAAFKTSFVVLLVYLYEPLFSLIRKVPAIGHHEVFLVVWSLIVLFVLFRKNKLNDAITMPLNAVSAVLVLFQLIPMTLSGSHGVAALNSVPESQASETGEFSADNGRPDIYYLVFDGYGRSDVLSKYYNFDNAPFLKTLESKGFFVGTNSFANYPRTNLSMASSLNMDYLHRLKTTSTKVLYRDNFWNNKVFEVLGKAGYKTKAYKTHWVANMKSADEYLDLIELEKSSADPIFSSVVYGLSPFEREVMKLTPLLPTLKLCTASKSGDDLDLAYKKHANNIYLMFDDLAKPINKLKPPQFTYAHFILPHPPFVFLPEGGYVQPDYAFATFDANELVRKGYLTKEEYVRGYVRNLKFLNKQINNVVNQIESNRSRDSIIILQSDHGPASTYKFGSNVGIEERYPILMAIKLPNEDRIDFSKSITPVNLFPYVFNYYLGSDFPYRENKSFKMKRVVKDGKAAMGFEDVSHQLKGYE